jgi:hypothetical protein
MSDTERIAHDADLVVALKQAVGDGNVEQGEHLAREMFNTNPDWIVRSASDDELEVRRLAHEVYAEFLLNLVFSESCESDLWRRMMMPTRGIFPHPVLVSNARWLRAFGSTLVEAGLEELDPQKLASLGFEGQAKYLGRFCAVNDGARAVDYDAVFEALDPRLRPAFGHWVTAVYLASPGTLADGNTAKQQATVAQAFTDRHSHDTSHLAGSSMLTNMPYSLCYRDDMHPGKIAPILNGQLTRRLLNEFGSKQPDPSAGQLASHLSGSDKLVLCPNWRDDHVAFRCCSDAVTGMRDAKLRVLMLHEPGVTAAPSTGWEDDTLNLTLSTDSHFVQGLGGAADEIKRAKLDFVYYPEVTPNNVTAWMATQRLGRVQAAGYGYPVTTGSPYMDYFIGGTEVEGDGSAYTEQLVLLPGLGVSTTAPPLPSRPRRRGFDEDDLKLVTITTWQKMNPSLLTAWEAILGDQPAASMDVFSAMTRGQATSLFSSIAPHIQDAKVNMQLTVPRDEVLTSLEDADLYLDSFPYGGFNSLVEVLASGCPVVTLEGPAARHRFGAAMLRRLELPEFLIAKTRHEFIATARRLMLDAGLRQDIRARLGSRDEVLVKLADPDIGAHFAAAVEWMRKAGPRHGRAGAPVRIEANAEPSRLNA